MISLSTLLYRAVAWVLAALVSAGLPVRLRGGDVTVTAHSGSLGLADNSIEAMQAGVQVGAQIVEFDLNFTTEGDPVLSHDAPQSDQSYVPLSDVFQFLRENKSILANVDVKSTQYLEKLLPLAEEYGVTEQLFMTGLDENSISIAKEKCPGIPYYLNVSVDKDTDLPSLIEKAQALGAIGLNLYWKGASRRLVRLCHRSGLLVSVWTVNDLRPILEMALIGADNITTRRPDLACAVIR